MADEAIAPSPGESLWIPRGGEILLQVSQIIGGINIPERTSGIYAMLMNAGAIFLDENAPADITGQLEKFGQEHGREDRGAAALAGVNGVTD